MDVHKVNRRTNDISASSPNFSRLKTLVDVLRRYAELLPYSYHKRKIVWYGHVPDTTVPPRSSRKAQWTGNKEEEDLERCGWKTPKTGYGCLSMTSWTELSAELIGERWRLMRPFRSLPPASVEGLVKMMMFPAKCSSQKRPPLPLFIDVLSKVELLP